MRSTTFIVARSARSKTLMNCDFSVFSVLFDVIVGVGMFVVCVFIVGVVVDVSVSVSVCCCVVDGVDG